MAQGNGALAMKAMSIRAAWGQVMGDALDRCEVGGAMVET